MESVRKTSSQRRVEGESRFQFSEGTVMVASGFDENALLTRITVNPAIFGGKPIIRGHRLAVEHVLSMLASGDSPEVILQGYSWLEQADVQACLVYAKRLVAHERVEPAITPSSGGAAA